MSVVPKKKKAKVFGKVRKLKILTEHIPRCKKCLTLRSNGMAIPFWKPESRFLGIAEAPGRVEVEAKTPLVGPAGDKWREEIERIGLTREDFVLLNSVQCRPVVSGRNGKPTFDEMINCWFWVKKYIESARPEKILAMGNYAVWSIFRTGSTLGGIMGSSGKLIGTCCNVPVYACIHPASLLYSNDNLTIFRESLRKFKAA